MFKSTLIALALMASIPAYSQEQEAIISRDTLQLVCNDVVVQQGVPVPQAAAVCNCSIRYLSFVYTDGATEDAAYNIPVNHPLIEEALQMCFIASEADPYSFRERFGVYTAEN